MILGMWATHQHLTMPDLERLAVGPERVGDVVRALREVPGVRGSFLLSTCNRLEAYVALAPGTAPSAVQAGLCEVLAGTSPVGAGHPFIVAGERDAVAHLFGVASGLESMVIGEYQIVAQLRDALHAAQAEGTIGPTLDDLVRGALRTSKLVRSRTGIGGAGTSMVGVGLAHARTALGGLDGAACLLVGAGRMCHLAGTLLRDAGATTVAVSNRTPERARALADRLGARVVPPDALGEAIAEVDLVVSITGSPGHVISAAQVARARATRPHRRLFLLDLAIPRDVEPAAAQLPGVHLVGVEEIGARMREAGEADEVGAARAVVADAVAQFLRRRQAHQMTPVIVALRASATQLVDAELRRLHERLPQLDHRTRAETDAALRRAVDKLIHTPTVRIKELATTPGGPMYRDALATLFDLEEAGFDLEEAGEA